MLIRKKVNPEAFQRILDGKQKFTIRLCDFDCKPGDVLLLWEWDPATQKYTGRKMNKKVGYVQKTKHMVNYYDKKDIEALGLQVISLE